jgi:CubicO group peptidase (beta-lactamase class C family)
MTRACWVVTGFSLLVGSGAMAQSPVRAGPEAPQRFAAGLVPPPRFADHDRLPKLARAFPDLERIFGDWAHRRHMPGYAFGVIVDGELVFAGAGGTRDVTRGAGVNADTVFRIASMTKSFTATAILLLRDDGRLALDDSAARWVPELAPLPYPTRDSPAITIRDLLTHSEGFPEDDPWGDRQLAASEEALSRQMREGIPFSSPPGLAFEYSNLGFAILGRIVSRASGMRYRDFVDARILAPLGMTSTFWEASAVPPDRLARGYRWADGGWIEEEPLADGAFGAMGGLYTSIRDLSRYVAFHLSAWPPRDDPDVGPLRRASLREMQQVWRATPARTFRDSVEEPLRLEAGGYGFGLEVLQTCRFRHTVHHGGGLPGYGSRMQWLPEHGVGMVALGNVTYAGWARAFVDAFEALARTGGLQPRIAQPSPALQKMQEAVSRLVSEWDDRLALEIAADNLFVDVPADRRRARLSEIGRMLGACSPDGSIEAENALRGTWRMACQRGALHVGIRLAPTIPPRVQSLGLRPAPALEGRLGQAASSIAALVGGWDPERAGPVFGAGVDAERFRRTIARAAVQRGTCAVGDVVEGDGTTRATVSLRCERGSLWATLQVDPSSGRVTEIDLRPPPEEACEP